MKAKKLLINIALTPLAVVFMLVVMVLCAASTVLRYGFAAPYVVFKAVSEMCQSLLRSFVEGYEKGRVTVLGEVSHDEKR